MKNIVLSSDKGETLLKIVNVKNAVQSSDLYFVETVDLQNKTSTFILVSFQQH